MYGKAENRVLNRVGGKSIAMKKFLNSIYLLMLTLSINTSSKAQLSCGSYDDFDSRFNNIGSFHNAHLSHVFNSFSPPDVSNYESGIEAVAIFLKDFTVKNQFSHTGIVPDPVVINEASDFNRYFINTMNFRELLMAETGQVSLTNCTQLTHGLPMSAENKTIMNTISNIIRESLNGRMQDAEVENNLVNLANDWLVKNEKKTEGSEIAGCVLSIGLKSCEWWRQHPEAKMALLRTRSSRNNVGGQFENEPGIFFVAWPIFDIAGALTGAIVNSATQLINNGHINASHVLVSAGTSAASASLGLVGKIAKWIKSIF
jgi:hypothetical protein